MVETVLSKRIEALLLRAREMTEVQQQNLEILLKTIDIKDAYGLKNRAAEILDYAGKLTWIAAQVDALRSIAYDPPEGKRRNSTQLQAPPVPREDPE